MTDQPSLSVVVPFFNEADGVAATCGELRTVIDEHFPKAEVILVDDGSTDGTSARLDEIARAWPRCRILHSPANEGQSAALLRGFRATSAPLIATLDGDGQNDPRDLISLMTKIDETDMVVGVRVNRQDSWMRRRISRIANSWRARLLGDGLADAGCALKVFRREVVEAFIPMRTLYSFMPALAVAAGYRVAELPVRHRSRKHGTSKYTVRSFLILPIVDCVGVYWFRSRRCRTKSKVVPTEDNVAEQFEQRAAARALRIWAMALLCTFIGGAIVVIWLLQTGDDGPMSQPRRKVPLAKAEGIALRLVPDGRPGMEQLWTHQGRLVWTIDLDRIGSPELKEVDIDATNGKVISMRDESPEEEALELAASEHVLQHKKTSAH